MALNLGVCMSLPCLRLRSFALWVLFAFTLWAGHASAQEIVRYGALLNDGSRITGRELSSWYEKSKEPKLDGKPLFKENHARWLIDQWRKISEGERTPEEYVEFFGGDRLPAKVLGFRFGNEDPSWTHPPHLVVDPTIGVHWPDKQPTPVRVTTHWLRRVVWQKRMGEQYRPATVFFRDGRMLEFRSLRWATNSVVLLREQGTMEIPFDQIAELHMARMSPWDAHFEQLAVLLPEGKGRWMQWETWTGITVTGSLNRFDAGSRGGNEANNWQHLIQPAWALDPLWLAHVQVRIRRYFSTNELPLTTLEPIASKQRNSLGGGWQWQQMRNVEGDLLKANNLEFGWGFGVHTYNELEFELHPAVRKFRTSMALDRSVGAGGCAKGLIYAGPAEGKPLYEGKILVGSNEVLDTGNLDWPQDAARKLTLVADPVSQGRPAGADPLDIRDTFDWLEPMLELDQGEVEKEIRQRVLRNYPTWRHWTMSESSKPLLQNQWDGTNQREPRFRMVAAAGEKLSFKRKFEIEDGQNWLMLAVSRIESGTQPSRVQVKINGREAGKFEVPVRRSSGDPDPMALPVDKYRGKEIEVEVIQTGDGPTALVDWRSVGLVDQLPGLKRLYEDEAEFLEQLVEGEAVVSLEKTDRYAGQNALRIGTGAKYNPRIAGLSAAIRDDPKLGEFRFIRFAWKKQGGESIVLELAHEGAWGKGGKRTAPTYRYDAGPNKAGPETATRVEKKTPVEWVVVTRDLYADFGAFNLTGVSLNCPDGESAIFDHIYLARTMKDFERIESPTVAADAREAEESVKGKTGDELNKTREAIMLIAEAETLARGRDNSTARERANRAISLLPKDSPLVRRAQKVLDKVDGN